MTTIGEIVSISKGHKATEVFDEPRPNAQRYLQIEDLRPDTTLKYASDSKGVLATADDVLIAWDGANAGTISFGLTGYAGSTLAVLKVDKKRAYAPFVGRFLQSQFATLREGCTGATIPHVDRLVLEGLRLELPSVAEQQRLAALLDKADHLRRTRRYAQQLSDTFLQSVFLEMFGEYLGAGGIQFKDVLEVPLSNGVFEKNTNYGSGTQVIWVDNLYHTLSIDMSDLRRARLNGASIKKYRVMEDDLLFTRSSLVKEGIGQINIVPRLREPATYECHTIRARINKKKAAPHYILGLYRSKYGRDMIMKRANTATMTTIGQEGIGELACPLPPLPLQQQFAQIVGRVERLRAQQREAARQAEHLFQTLLHRAFRGEV